VTLSDSLLAQFRETISPKPVIDHWALSRRPNQTPPDGDWSVWLIMAGRGFGKTRTGAEWVREQIMRLGAIRVALVAPTAADARDVMVQGESGLIACCERYGIRAHYKPSLRRVDFPNGAVAFLYSADEPERLRGPQHHLGWGDEIAAWRRPEAWDQLQFGMRLGQHPQTIGTTTPKPVDLVRTLLKRSTDGTGDVVVSAGSTYDNAANLAPSFLATIKARYEGTQPRSPGDRGRTALGR
jgi:phage terminase large subunit-like protein